MTAAAASAARTVAWNNDSVSQRARTRSSSARMSW